MTHKIVLLLIVIVGLLIRIWRIDLPLLEFYPTRQVQTAEITRNLSKDFDLLKPKVHFYGPGEGLFLLEFPLYNLPIAIFYKFVGSPQEYFGRLFSILGWGISALILYKLARKYTGEFCALSSVFIYTFSPLSVLTSRSFQPDQWMLTFSMAAIFYIDKWLAKRKPLFFYLGSIACAVAILIKLPAVVFTLVPILLIMWSRQRLNLLNFAKFALISLAPSTVWYLYSASLAKESGLSNAFAIYNWFRPELFLNPQFYTTFFGYQYNLGLLPIGMLMFLIGLVIKLKKEQSILYFWLLSIAIYFIIFNRHNMVHEYYHLPFLPIASIFIGIGAKKIIDSLNGLVISKNLFLVLCFLLLTVLMLPPTLARAYKPIDRFSNVLDAAGALKRVSNPNDLIVGIMDRGPTLVYYADRVGWNLGLDRERQLKEEEFYTGRSTQATSPIVDLNTYVDKGAKYLAIGNVDQLDANVSFKNYVYNNFKLIEETNKFLIFDLTGVPQ